MFKTRKKLQHEIESLKDENAKLTQRIDSLTDEVNSAQQRNLDLMDKSEQFMAENRKLKTTLDLSQKETRRLEKLAREQTEADLLLNALKAVKIVPDDGPDDYFADYFAENRRLLDLQNKIPSAAHQQHAYSQGFDSLGGALNFSGSKR